MTDRTGVWTIVVAAGSSRRFGANKLDVRVTGTTTVLEMSVQRAVEASEGAVLVLHADDPRLRDQSSRAVTSVAGGRTRSESVRCGLAAVPLDATIVLVHDAARPLADMDLYDRVISAVRAGGTAVVPVVPVVDTIRSVDAGAVDRDLLRAVQTPQGFSAPALREAHSGQGDATDDASLVEALGYDVVLVDGDARNLKITTPTDLDLARSLLRDGAGSRTDG